MWSILLVGLLIIADPSRVFSDNDVSGTYGDVAIVVGRGQY